MSARQGAAPSDQTDDVTTAAVTGTPTSLASASVSASSATRTPKSSPAVPELASRGARRIHCNTCNTFSSTDKKEFYNHRRTCACQDLAAEDATLETPPHHRRASLRHSRASASDLKTAPTVAKGSSSASEKTPPAPLAAKGERASKRAAALNSTLISPLATKTFKSSRRSSASCTVKETPLVDSAEVDQPEASQEDQNNEKPVTGLKLVLQHVTDRQPSSRRVKQEWAALPKTPTVANKSPVRGSDSTKEESSPRVEKADSDSNNRESSFDKTSAGIRSAENSNEIAAKIANVSSEAKIRLTNVLAELKLTAELKSGSSSAASPKPADPEQPLRADMPAEEGSPSTATQAEKISAIPAVVNYSYSDSDDDDYMEGGDDYDMDEPPLVMADYVTANGSPATRPGNIQNRTYMCKMCGFSTNSAMENLIHEKDEHGLDFDIYKCDQCDYATKYKQKLPRHRRLHYSGKRQPFVKALDVSDNGSSPSVKSPAAVSAASSLPPTLLPASAVAAVSQTVAAFAGVKRTSAEAFCSEVNLLPPEVVMDENDDEEGEEDEIDDNGSPRSSTPGAGAAVAPPAKKKRKDVSPDKYFEVADELASTKFGCAICGNVYKWKKSLNKHWKEKHATHPGNQEEVPPGMQVLIDQGNHEFTEPRRCCHKSLLAKISIPRPEALHHRQNVASPSTPENFLNGHYRRHDRGDEMDGAMAYGFHSSPMGPFTLGISQPVFPGQRQLLNTLNGPIQTSSVLNLSTHSSHDVDETDSIVEDNARPLDFSAKGDGGNKGEQHRSARSSPSVSSIFSTSTHEATTEEDEEVSALNQLAAANKEAAGSQGKEVLKCPRCGEVCKTQTAYSNHMAIHNPTSNKRVARCAQCSLHFPNNDALNSHFQDVHIDLIASHKEAIQKIPHGLQQTYHLLMPIQNIPKLTSQGTDDPLKCNMCDFTAKWPAELQKHAVSHSDERPFICMVCGSTYKWKWDLVKHFEKAHANLPNPYKRRDQNSFPQTQTSDGASTSAVDLNGQDDDDAENDDDLPPPDLNASNSSDPPESFLFDQNSQEEISSVENMLRTSQQAAVMLKSQQPNFLDGPSDSQSSSNGQAQPLRLPNSEGALLQNASGLGFGSSGANRPGSKNSLGKSSRGRPSSGLHYPKSKSGASSGSCRPWMSYRTVEGTDSELKFMCLHCDYKARWPSEITQHMKNHSTEKPYGCPNCSYRSKWKWDVVKHLKRCGGGTIKDVIDFSNLPAPRDGPPNVMVTPEGGVVSQPQAHTPPSHAASEEQPPPPSDIPDANLLMHTFFIPPGTTSTSHKQLALLYNLYSAHHAALPKDPSSSSVTGPSLPTPTTSDAATSSSSSTPEPPSAAGNAEPSGGQSCMICHLVTPSAAELKRHMVMHSEEKPYKCECGYCTRWKCDVKKHKDKYQHGGPVKIVRGDGTEEYDKDTKQCSHCSFLTYSDEVLLKHVQDKHKDLKTPSKTPTGKKSPLNRKSSPSEKRSPDTEDKKSPLKFNCSPCSYSTNELAEWVNHRRQHQSSGCETRQSPNLNGFNDVDDARLKHPRKTVKRSCYKCNFTCLKSSELKAHFLEVHGAHKCAFCDLHFATKTTLLDHLITHPEFNCAEWEPFFADNDDEDFNNNTAVNEDAGSKNSTDAGSNVSTLDPNSSSSTSSRLVGFSPGQDKAAKSYDCELCDKRFTEMKSLVYHVQANHSEEMKRKEIGKAISMNSGPVINGGTFLSPNELKVAVINSLTKGASFTSLQTSPNIVTQLRQPLGGLFKVNPLVPALPSPLSSPPSEKGLNLSIKKSPSPSSFYPSSSTASIQPAPPSGKGQGFQCRECPFATQDMASFVEHAHMHSKLAAAAAHNPALSLATLAAAIPCTQCKGVTFPSLAAYREHLVKTHNVLLPVTGLSSKQQTAASVGPKTGQDKMKSPVDVANFLRVEKVMTFKQVPIQCHKLNNELMYKCTECHLMNKSCQSVYTHMMSVHGRKIRTHPLGAGAYFCGICGMQFDSFQRALMHHTTAHREAKPEVVLRYYEDISANQERIACKACDNVALSVDEMRAHLAYYPFSCEPCAFHADSKEDMSSHYAQEHAASKTSMRSLLDFSSPSHPSLLGDVRSPYNPAACPPSVATSRDLTPLDLTAENDRKDSAVARKMTSAAQGIPDLSKVKEERRSSQEEVKAAEDKRAQPSPLTPSSTGGSSSSGNNSNNNSSNKRVFKCAHCPFTTDVSQCVYRNHCKGHGLKKRYPCDYCTYSQDVLAELMEHRLLHRDLPDFINEYLAPEPEPALRTPTPPPPASPPRPLECPDCPFQTTDRAAFQEHAEKHSLRLPHICDFCDWTDHTVISLRLHRQVHADDEEYAEDPSDAVFANPEYAVQGKEELKAVVISETTSSPTALPILSIKKMVYACAHCPYESRNGAAFDYHSQLHGGPGCFACDKCSYHTDRWSLSCQHSRLHADREADVDVAPPPLDVEQDLAPPRQQTASPTADRQSPNNDRSPVEREASAKETPDKALHPDQAADETLAKAQERELKLNALASTNSAPPAAEASQDAVDLPPASSSSDTEGKKNTRVYCCTDCEEEFTDKRLLLQHYEERHK